MFVTHIYLTLLYSSFFFNDTPTTEIYTYGHTLSLHDALPISRGRARLLVRPWPRGAVVRGQRDLRRRGAARPAVALRGGTARQVRKLAARSEEHTSELQSLMRISYAVFCLKKKKIHILI